MGRRRPSAIGAAIGAVNRLFDSVDDELNLPEDRDEWDEDDYEEERDAIGRKLVEISGRMARLRSRLRNTARQRDHFRGSGIGSLTHTQLVAQGYLRPPAGGYRRVRPGGAGGLAIPTRSTPSALTSNVAIQTTPGTQAVVIPLESGVFLVAEASSALLASAGAEKVAKALQQAAGANLLSTSISGRKQHWTEKL